MKLYYPDYSNSIMNVTNSILKHYGVKVTYPTIPLLDDELAHNYNHIIYILLDGMGTNVIHEHLNEEDALRKHLKQEVTSVFPPTTVAATDAVLSGLPPISNGHVAWTQYFEKEQSHTVVFQNHDYYTHKKHDEDLREKYLSFKKIYAQINDASPDVGTFEYFPSFREGGSDSFSEEIDKVLIKTHNTDKSFNYLYWTEPDLSEHLYGPYSKEVKTVMQNLNNDFESLIQNITDDTLVIVIADHGLTNVKEIKLYDYPELTDHLRLKPSLEPRATGFYVKPDKHEQFKTIFNKLFEDKFKLYTKEEILKTNIFGVGNKHPLFDSFLGDFVSISISEYMFVFDKSKGYVGHHAGLSKDEMMVPLIIYKK